MKLFYYVIYFTIIFNSIYEILLHSIGLHESALWETQTHTECIDIEFGHGNEDVITTI
jgi:hypothetical protein